MRFAIENRVIQTGFEYPLLGTQGENDIEEVEFTIPKIVGKADLGTPGTRCVLYLIGEGNREFNKILDFSQLDENTMIARWLVGREETQDVGNLSVAIHFSTVFDNLLRTKLTTFRIARTINAESPQPVMFRNRAAKSSGMAEPMAAEAEPEIEVIYVVGNELIIQAALQNIAVQNDNESRFVQIKLPRKYAGEDLSKYPFRLHVETQGGSEWVSFVPQLTSDEITLLWTLRRPHTSYAGKISVQLEIGTENTNTFFKQTKIAVLNVLPSLGSEPIVPVSPPEFAEYLRQIEAIRAQAITAKNESVGARDISVAKAGEASASAAAALKSQNAAAGSATTASTKAGEASKSAAAAKVSETASAGSLTDIQSGLVSKLSISEANSLIKSVALDEKTGVFTFTRYDKSVLRIDTALEKTVMNFVYDARTKELVLTLESGQVLRIPLSDLIDDYSGADTATVSVAISGDNRVSAVIRGNSIAMNLLDLALQNTINGKVTANQSNNAAQIKFADGQNMQQKLDAGAFDGEDGKDGKDAVFAPVDGMYYMRVDEKGRLVVGVNGGGSAPPLVIRGGQLVYTVG